MLCTACQAVALGCFVPCYQAVNWSQAMCVTAALQTQVKNAGQTTVPHDHGDFDSKQPLLQVRSFISAGMFSFIRKVYLDNRFCLADRTWLQGIHPGKCLPRHDLLNGHKYKLGMPSLSLPVLYCTGRSLLVVIFSDCSATWLRSCIRGNNSDCHI